MFRICKFEFGKGLILINGKEISALVGSVPGVLVRHGRWILLG
jgi:hypothetical protein